MITRIEDYFSLGCGRCPRFATADCSTRPWAEGLRELRTLCLGMNLIEALKWGHPCYVHHDRNIAIIGALRDEFRLSFFDAALLKDPQGVLSKQGQYTPYPDMIRFTSHAQVVAMKETIRSYLAEAIGYAEAGIKPPKIERVLDWPEELLEALEADPPLAAAFHRLSPGRQTGYLIHLNSAKKSETRSARLVACRERILAGKGLFER